MQTAKYADIAKKTAHKVFGSACRDDCNFNNSKPAGSAPCAADWQLAASMLVKVRANRLGKALGASDRNALQSLS